MTTDKKDEQDGYSRWTKLLFVLGALVIFLGIGTLLYLPIFVFFFPAEGTEYIFDCREYEGGLKEEWLLSDNITGYKDIPENQKKNLSTEAIDALKSLGEGSFTSSNYTELTGEQKRNFKKDLNGERVVVRGRDATPPSHVSYRGQMYTCDTDQMTD